MDWRKGIAKSDELAEYRNCTECEFPLGAFRKAVILGDRLIDASGSYEAAVRQVQNANLELQDECAKNVWGDRLLFPSVAESLSNILTHGVIPEFYGRIPTYVGKRGLLHEVQKTDEIAENCGN